MSLDLAASAQQAGHLLVVCMPEHLVTVSLSAWWSPLHLCLVSTMRRGVESQTRGAGLHHVVLVLQEAYASST